jgi:predicted porin
LSKDWLETRFVYLQSKVRQKNVSGSWDADPESSAYGQYIDAETDFTTPSNRQQIYGLTFNVDYHNFLVRSEFIHINHNEEAGYKDHAQIFGVGYRFGKLTPMVTVANYRSQAIVSSGAESDAQEAHRTTSFTLRYDLTPSSAVKVQLDLQKDRSGPNYTIDGYNRFGDARLLTATYDMVF